MLLLVASAALERLRLHSLAAELPLAPGGMVGDGGGRRARRPRSASPARRSCCSTLAAIGLSLFIGISWLAHRRGRRACCSSRPTRWRAAPGSAAATTRSASRRARSARPWCRPRSKREEDHPPLRHRAAAGRDQEVRARAEGEAGAAVREPARHAAAAAQAARRGRARSSETVSAETLEFTSRLIEKKLSDFGVAVKVLAAYPGPGDHALRDRARGRASRAARSSTWSRTWRARCRWWRSAWSRPSRASPAWAWRSRTRTARRCA